MDFKVANAPSEEIKTDEKRRQSESVPKKPSNRIDDKVKKHLTSGIEVSKYARNNIANTFIRKNNQEENLAIR